MITDVVLDLVERGVVTGARKEINRGRVVATFMLGTQRLYDLVDDNPMVEMRPADYTNDTAVIRRFKQMVAINSAIEIDLTGQVCADSIGSAHVQRRRRPDGLHPRRGAGRRRPRDHRPALDRGATAAVSRIVPYLAEGAGVVTTRAHVETIVTEWGVAELHGRSIARAGTAADRHRRPALPRRARVRGAPRSLHLGAGSSVAYSLACATVLGDRAIHDVERLATDRPFSSAARLTSSYLMFASPMSR